MPLCECVQTFVHVNLILMHQLFSLHGQSQGRSRQNSEQPLSLLLLLWRNRKEKTEQKVMTFWTTMLIPSVQTSHSNSLTISTHTHTQAVLFSVRRSSLLAESSCTSVTLHQPHTRLLAVRVVIYTPPHCNTAQRNIWKSLARERKRDCVRVYELGLGTFNAS